MTTTVKSYISDNKSTIDTLVLRFCWSVAALGIVACILLTKMYW
ncbi:hypothetical protein [Hafnia paralvei]|nr:hypothetical protein [Hafnia paralvei]